MIIGILQADHVVEQFQPAHGDYPEMISGILNQAALAETGDDWRFVTFDVEQGIYPEGIDDCDGYVITGSKKSVYDEDVWITDLKSYVCELDANKKPLVGLCFGHQLVADALGGKTRSAEVGWGVGIHESEIVDHRWFMDADSTSFNLIVSHKDQVVTLPAGAERLASSDFCANSMFCVGDHVFAMQGHPEFDRNYSRDLLNWREEILGPKIFRAGVASLKAPLSREQIARWIIRFLMGKPAGKTHT
jgi:GMP synthase-like glutamine amidotransferase